MNQQVKNGKQCDIIPAQPGNVTVKLNEGLSPLLAREEVEYVKANLGQRISLMEKGETLTRILEIVNMAYAELNQMPAGDTDEEQSDSMKMITKLIYYDIIHYFPNITINELTLAVKNGIRGRYGKYYNNFSTVTVHRFVEGYLEEEERMEAIKKQNRFLASHEEVSIKLTPEEIENTMQEAIIRCYENYYKSGEIWDWGSICYYYAIEKRFIVHTREEMQETTRLATQLVNMEKLNERMSIAQWARKVEDAETLELEIKMKARRISLERFFKSLGKHYSWDFSNDAIERKCA